MLKKLRLEIDGYKMKIPSLQDPLGVGFYVLLCVMLGFCLGVFLEIFTVFDLYCLICCEQLS